MTFDQIRDAINSAFREYQTYGVPSSGAWEPVKAEVRAALATLAIALDDGGFSEPPDWAADLAEVVSQLETIDAAVARLATADFEQTNAALFGVSDADGNVVIDIKSPLLVDAQGGLATMASRSEVAPGSQWLLSFGDTDGNLVLAVDASGRLVANLSGASSAVAAPDGLFDYSLNGLFCYGQSLAVGQALPLQSGVPAYDHVMFQGGLRPQYDDPSGLDWYDTLLPAVEFAPSTGPYAGVLGETPSRGTADAVKALIAAENDRTWSDHQYQLLLSNPGYGASSIAQLSKGSVHFTRMVDQAAAGLVRANETGLTFAMQAVTWVQGESDYQISTTYAAYLSSLNQLVADIQTDLKAETGQTKAIAVIGAQIASHIYGATDDVPDIALAQLACSVSNTNFYLACAMYPLAYADEFHLTGSSSRLLGAYLGLAYKRVVIDGEDWQPVRPLSAVTQDTVVEVRFHVPRGRLTLDTTLVASQPDMGFELVEDDGTPIVIASVAVVDFDRVRIVAGATVPADAKLRYAWQGDANRGLGNLRDTQGEALVFDPAGLNKPLHNWCVIFELEL